VFKDKLIAALKVRKSTDNNGDKEMFITINKIQKQKRLSSNEFLKVYNLLWKKGPTVLYQDSGVKYLHFQSIKSGPESLNLEKRDLK
jgi:hypothetical protein